MSSLSFAVGHEITVSPLKILPAKTLKYHQFLQDEDWENLCRKLQIKDEEMSLDQFLQLHKLEAKSGESVELWMALWTMGFNHSLQSDESFNFKVS